MLWTIMPEDFIMENNDKINHAQEYLYEGRRILGYPRENGKVEIVQLLSSNPADYLNPRLSPGSTVFAKKL